MFDPHLPSDSSFARDYRIVRVLVEREASILYVAEQLSTGTFRALETLRPAPRRRSSIGRRVGRPLRAVETLPPPAPLNEIERARFLSEMAGASLFESPYVARVVDAGIEEGAPWLATELPGGASLDQQFRHGDPFGPRATVVVLAQVGRALAAAHEAGIIHGHLTPHCVFLSEQGLAGDPVKVLGFGIGRLLSWRAQGDTAEASSAEPAADLRALGLLAFLMLTGRSYWMDASALELMNEATLEPLVPASERARELQVERRWQPAFDAWFARCVSRDPEERFHGAAAAVEELLALDLPLDLPEEVEAPVVSSPTRRPLVLSNPKGSLYDDGLQDSEHDPDPTGDVGRSAGPYRRGVARPRMILLSNPEASLYDEGHARRSRPSARWLAAVVIFLSLAAAALWLLLFRR
jgi:serine/threonine protein kinase